MRWLAIGSTVVLGAAALGTAWLVGMRNKQSAVVRMQRKVNKALLNPGQMATAGTPGAYAAVVHHVGRRSGTQYRTPVGVVATDDGFVIGLVYGSQADWVQNLLAAGSGELTHEGTTYAVAHPEVVPFDSVVHAFPADDRRSARVVNVQECLRLTAQPVETAISENPGGD
ncbi:MAG: nitroreductase family deazaflavin-dependent oxidoreductase [Jiangellales bacterium]